MTALPALIDLVVRLGAELDFDVGRDVESVRGGRVDVVWFDRCLPLAAVTTVPIDLRSAPVLPVVAFDVRTPASIGEADAIASIVLPLESTGAPLRILVIAREGRHVALAPTLQSVDRMHNQEDDAALSARITESLQSKASVAGRTIVMPQHELTEWAKGVREAKPRSYSAESLFNRTGKID
jgi:hypothetical protein